MKEDILLNRLESDAEPIMCFLSRLAKGKEIFSIQDVADMLEFNYRSVYRQVTSGELNAYRWGGKWLIALPDLAVYLRQHSTTNNSLDSVLQSLHPLEPEDFRFRQELGEYMKERQQAVSARHSLNDKYARMYATNEVCALLEGRWGEIPSAGGDSA